jgi:hypothetical protein
LKEIQIVLALDRIEELIANQEKMRKNAENALFGENSRLEQTSPSELRQTP